MPRPRYRLHCTDGHEALFDRAGVRLRHKSQVWMAAEAKAREVMGSCSGELEWSDWIVDVHDEKGSRVLTLAFEDVRELREAA